MNLLSPFIVLIERRRARRMAVSLLAWVSLAIGALGFQPAHAQSMAADGRGKMARDLHDELGRSGKTMPKWVREVNGVRHVQAIVVSNSPDPEMTELRNFVIRTGGSVHAVHPAVHAITVQVKAGLVQALSDRSDVISVSPNRVTQHTASTLESVSGALTANVRGTSSKTSYSGLDGSGIGIAVLDSGVMHSHDAFLDGYGATRIPRHVNMLNTTQTNWTTGTSATSLSPGSYALAAYENQVDNGYGTSQDGYGHGTHVASVAAGRAKYYASGTPDTTGIAPNASVYDVKVLSDAGTGTLSDALEGIQWVIYHAKEYNIRVLNVSLATNSTQT